MKSIKLGHYSKSYYDNIDKPNYRYEIAWYCQPLIHMGDILNEIEHVVKVKINVRPFTGYPLIIPTPVEFALGFD